MDGQQFMVINKVADPGLIKNTEAEILPELEARVPNQSERIATSGLPYPHKFALVLIVKAYSPELMKRLKVKKVLANG